MLSKELEKSLNGVAQEASLKRHEFVTVEHLLLALLNNDQAINVLVNVGADVEKLRAELEKYIDDTTPTLQMDDSERGTQTTLGFQRVALERYFMFNRPVAKRLLAPMSWSPFLASRKAKRFTYSSPTVFLVLM